MTYIHHNIIGRGGEKLLSKIFQAAVIVPWPARLPESFVFPYCFHSFVILFIYIHYSIRIGGGGTIDQNIFRTLLLFQSLFVAGDICHSVCKILVRHYLISYFICNLRHFQIPLRITFCLHYVRPAVCYL